MHQLRVASRSVQRSCFRSCTSRRPCHPTKRQTNVHVHHCLAAGSVKSSPSYDQSVLHPSPVASCLQSLLAFALLCFCSHHGPFIVRIANLFHSVKGFIQVCTHLDVHSHCRERHAETGFVPTSAQLFAVGTVLILRSPS